MKNRMTPQFVTKFNINLVKVNFCSQVLSSVDSDERTDATSLTGALREHKCAMLIRNLIQTSPTVSDYEISEVQAHSYTLSAQ